VGAAGGPDSAEGAKRASTCFGSTRCIRCW
jgi:hypothetical protein